MLGMISVHDIITYRMMTPSSRVKAWLGRTSPAVTLPPRSDQYAGSTSKAATCGGSVGFWGRSVLQAFRAGPDPLTGPGPKKCSQIRATTSRKGATVGAEVKRPGSSISGQRIGGHRQLEVGLQAAHAAAHGDVGG